MKTLFRMALTLILTGSGFSVLNAQELFVFSEPASNMPAKSLGLRASNWLMYDKPAGVWSDQFLPELMWGVNKNLMIHLDGFFTNQNGNFHGVGGGTYVKYRLYTADDVNRHFRMAAFVRLSINNSGIFQEEIDLTRNNSGYALGFIATQLLHKQAISATIGFDQAYNNGSANKFPAGQANQALGWNLSTGRLILPVKYKNYRQTNMNMMFEILGQHLIGGNKNFVDIAPALQLIFNSQTRLDIGYKIQIYSDMDRVAQNGLMIRVEHLLFNVF